MGKRSRGGSTRTWGGGSKDSNKRARQDVKKNRQGQKRRHPNDSSGYIHAGGKRRKQPQQQKPPQPKQAGQVPQWDCYDRHKSSDWMVRQQQHHSGKASGSSVEAPNSCCDWMAAFPDRPPPQPLVPLAAHRSSDVPANDDDAGPTHGAHITLHEQPQKHDASVNAPLGQRVRVRRRPRHACPKVRVPPDGGSDACITLTIGARHTQSSSSDGGVPPAEGDMQQTLAVQPRSASSSAAVPRRGTVQQKTVTRPTAGPQMVQSQPALSTPTSPRIAHLHPAPSSTAVQRSRVVQLTKVTHSSAMAPPQAVWLQQASKSAAAVQRPRMVHLTGFSREVQNIVALAIADALDDSTMGWSPSKDAALANLMPMPHFKPTLPPLPPTPMPTTTPTPTPTATPTFAPTSASTIFPTSAPTPRPSLVPTPSPTSSPTPYQLALSAPVPTPVPIHCGAGRFRVMLKWRAVNQCLQCPAGKYRAANDIDEDSCFSTLAPTPRPTPQPTMAPTPVPICTVSKAKGDIPSTHCVCARLEITMPLASTDAVQESNCGGTFTLLKRNPDKLSRPSYYAPKEGLYLFGLGGGWAIGHMLHAAPYECVAASGVNDRLQPTRALEWHVHRDGSSSTFGGFQPIGLHVRCARPAPRTTSTAAILPSTTTMKPHIKATTTHAARNTTHATTKPPLTQDDSEGDDDDDDGGAITDVIATRELAQQRREQSNRRQAIVDKMLLSALTVIALAMLYFASRGFHCGARAQRHILPGGLPAAQWVPFEASVREVETVPEHSLDDGVHGVGLGLSSLGGGVRASGRQSNNYGDGMSFNGAGFIISGRELDSSGCVDGGATAAHGSCGDSSARLMQPQQTQQIHSAYQHMGSAIGDEIDDLGSV